MTGDVRRVSCRCGAVAVLCEGAPSRVSYCHCADCRRQSGAPVSVFVQYGLDRLELTGSEPSRWQSSAASARLFCERCGSQIGYLDAHLPDQIFLMLGAFEDPSGLTPSLHAFERERLVWFDTLDDLPRHPASSFER